MRAEATAARGGSPDDGSAGSGPPGGAAAGGGGTPRSRRLALPWATVALWVVLLALLGPFAGQLSGETEDDSLAYLPDSAESTEVAQIVRELPGGGTDDVILVHQREDGLTGEDLAVADRHAETVADRLEVVGDLADPVVSEDGTTAFRAISLAPDQQVPGGGEDAEDDPAAAAVDLVRDIVGQDLPEGLTAQVGGPAAIGADAGSVFQSIDLTLTLATVAVVTVLLIVIYRSPLLWLLPLVCVGIAAMAAMATVYALVQVFGITVSTQASSIMTVLVFGAGTDYALLLVARYRDELREHRVPYEAMRTALRGCVPALLASSGTVAAGLLCLMAADHNSSNGLGPVGAAGVLCALLVMVSLLPALLVLCGRRVFWPLVPEYGSEPGGRGNIFARMGTSVSRRPAALLVGGLVLLGALSLGNLNLPGPLKDEDFFTQTPDSVVAMQTVADAFPGQSTQPITVVADSDHADAAVAAAEETDGVARVVPGRAADGWTEINVFAAGASDSVEERETVRELREALAEVDGRGALVGGNTAQAVDLDDTNARDRVVVIPLVLISVLLILVLLFRSLVAAALVLTAVVVSWGAALGLGGLFFGPVFGFEGMDGWIPLLTFAFSVSLGVDYGIFLMHRMREEALRGAETREAVLIALRKTGGVIASAGIVLAATFGVLMSLPLVVMVELGFVVAVGVLMDTFLVRPYLLTSACWLLDRRMWWPGALSRPGGAPGGGGRGAVPPAGGTGGTGGASEAPGAPAGDDGVPAVVGGRSGRGGSASS
ncbi:MMPL family transporter [Streptomyces bohaiensis]|uniref:MMPL family transporter n=1 Tax=Streptomyces bohaiensis TaxID=1431344 RepID=A0ABX1CF04_9ACTN|nr:MMPL family transporter [Streptomyces bohaiensis]NJQ17642.1 MMPL family transporter [Streptomyces bohaiensis]